MRSFSSLESLSLPLSASSSSPERWLPVVGYEGLYEVSSDGDVRNAKTKKCLAKELSGRAKNYHRVNLWQNNKRKHMRVHQLVAAAFLGRCLEGYIICHRNDDGFDNRLVNLYYGTREDNELDRYINGLPLDEMEEAPF